MDVIIRPATVVAVSPSELTITVRDDATRLEEDVHWTSYWSDFPGQRPCVGGPIEIVCTRAQGRLIAIRPVRKV